ncbi:MAG: hypothetical protein RR942_06500 [Romboutsia sp.]
MKIWEARLLLNINDEEEYYTYFSFELAGDKFKVNEKYTEWSYFEDFVMDRVPMNIRVEEHYGTIATQGFDRELTEEEQKEVKGKMKEKMLVFLAVRQQQINKIYDEKIQTLLDMENK